MGEYKPRIVGGHVITPADLERTYKYLLNLERVEAISGEMRAVVEELWPELVHKAAVQIGRVAIVIKVKLVCDGCAAVIGDGINAINVRVEAQGCYQRRNGRDLCLVCAALPPNGQTSARRKYWGKRRAHPRRGQ
jgi:hypothetical protein